MDKQTQVDGAVGSEVGGSQSVALDDGELGIFECCPRCHELSVTTFAFNGWESFCPDCRIGDGMFNDWPSKKATKAQYEKRVAGFAIRLNRGDYLSIGRLNVAIRAGIEADLAALSAPSSETKPSERVEVTEGLSYELPVDNGSHQSENVQEVKE